jgi:hypothetical protein
LDDQTKKKMKTPRCSLPDFDEDDDTDRPKLAKLQNMEGKH